MNKELCSRNQIGPEVGPEISPPNSAGGCLFNGDSRVGRTSLRALKHLVKRRIARQSELPLKFCDREYNAGSEVHSTLYNRFATNRVKSLQPYFTNECIAHTCDMDSWPQRAAFSARLKEYQKQTGKTQAQAAIDLGLSLDGLRQILYQKKRRARLDTCQRAASVFGCSVTEFLDDPGANPAGVDLSTHTPMDRYRFGRMIESMNELPLTEEDKDILFEDWMRDAQRRAASNQKREKK